MDTKVWMIKILKAASRDQKQIYKTKTKWVGIKHKEHTTINLYLIWSIRGPKRSKWDSLTNFIQTMKLFLITGLTSLIVVNISIPEYPILESRFYTWKHCRWWRSKSYNNSIVNFWIDCKQILLWINLLIHLTCHYFEDSKN